MNRYRNVLSQALLQQQRTRLVDSLRVKSSTKVEAMDRIHVLGAGNLGVFMAHSLRKSHPELPITLMVRRSAMLKSWADFGRSIEIVTNGESEHQSNYNVEVFGKTENDPPMRRTTISNLIVATKAPSTKAAVKQVLDQLKPTSTLLFLQNGMGTIEEVETLFNSAEKPSFLAAITNHGLYRNRDFSSVHAGIANMIIGPVSGFDNAESANKLMELLLSTPALVPSKVPSSELLRIQLRKLVVNAVINPLTVVFDCYNGEIFKPERDPLIEKLVAEISAVTRRILLEDNPEADLEEFSSQRLEEVVRDIGAKTATNISSMRQDVLAGRETEIDYINGYVVRRAKEFDIACDCNEQVVQFVKTAELQQDKGLSRIQGKIDIKC